MCGLAGIDVGRGGVGVGVGLRGIGSRCDGYIDRRVGGNAGYVEYVARVVWRCDGAGRCRAAVGARARCGVG